MPHPYDVLTDGLNRDFPDWNYLGGHNCRKIRGSARWSDHAYLTPRPHALDIGVPDLAAPYADRLAWGDEVLRWLQGWGFDRLGIRYVRWREDSAHRGHHLHVSFLPNQAGKLPACRGGPPDLPAPDIAPLDTQEAPMTIAKGHPDRRQVVVMQVQLNRWRRLRGYDPIDEDGIFGAETEAAVVGFQSFHPSMDAPDGVWRWTDAVWLAHLLPGPQGPKGDPGPPGKDADPEHRHSLPDTTGWAV